MNKDDNVKHGQWFHQVDQNHCIIYLCIWSVPPLPFHMEVWLIFSMRTRIGGGNNVGAVEIHKGLVDCLSIFI